MESTAWISRDSHPRQRTGTCNSEEDSCSSCECGMIIEKFESRVSTKKRASSYPRAAPSKNKPRIFLILTVQPLSRAQHRVSDQSGPRKAGSLFDIRYRLTAP